MQVSITESKKAEALMEVHIPITGMTCAACANRIEKGLNKIEGIEKANVNLALERATVTFDPERSSVQTLEDKIEALGYGIVTERADFNITGMTCAACSGRIEKGLSKMQGIKKATVNLALETARVEYDPLQVNIQEMEEKVKKLGYEARVKKEDQLDFSDLRERKLHRQKRKFIISLILSLPLIWAMASHFSFTSFLYVPALFLNPWFQLILATPVQFWIGGQFYIGAYKALKNNSANMDVLVVLGTSAAYFYSLYVMAIPMKMADVYFETSAVLITLILMGKWFEAKAKGRSSEAIKKLMGIQAKTAIVLKGGIEKEVPLEEIHPGDVLLIKPGAKVPVDGTIIEGQSAVDESVLTGESVPVDKQAGDTVMGATLNKNGFLKVEATKVGRDTALAQIIRIVEEAQGAKAPIQRLADKISGIFVPIVVGIALIIFIVNILWISPGQFTVSLEKLISVLVIACPCALGLATPTSIMAGSGRAAEYGILFKSGEHLEQTHQVTTVVLDKTGTITYGEPILTDVLVEGYLTEAELLQLAGSAEAHSEHPLADAIVHYVKEKQIPLLKATAFQAVPGFGVEAVINGEKVLVGTRKWLERHHIDLHASLDKMNRLEEAGKTAMLVAADGEYAGMIAVADRVKETSQAAIKRLKEMGLEVVMMTGDNRRTAASIAEEVGIDNAISEVLPESKAEEIKKLQRGNKKVAMVGDGINDAPALAVADIGMAVGTGTDIAIETADITLMRSDLTNVADAIYMSKMTTRNIKQNLFWAFAYNCIGIPVAAAGLLQPWIAGAAMAFSSVSVVLNALRLQRITLK
jgi:Cu+-exporting ATPase